MSQDKNTSIEKQIWNTACIMRGKIPKEQYKDVILTLIFLKYANERFEKTYNALKKLEWTSVYRFANNPQNYIVYNSIYLNKEARWSTIQETPEEKIGFALDRALINLKLCNKSLENAVSCNFRSEEIDKRVLKKVVDAFSKIDLSGTETDSDLIGRVYEFCLKNFAINEKGEYYTPKSVVNLLVNIVQPFENCTLYEPCAGSGGMIVQSFKYLKAHGGSTMQIYAQEAAPSAWRIAKQNMAIRGIRADFGTVPADTFHNDQHKGVKADCIMANPPFNLSSWGYDTLKMDPRWVYGEPSDVNANYAWIEHMLYHLKENGRMGVVMPNGTGSSLNPSDMRIRKELLEEDLLEGIVSLPRNMFYSTTVPATIWFFTKGKTQKGRVLFVDAKSFGKRDKRLLEFSDADIRQISSCFESFRSGNLINIPGIAKSVSIDEIRKHDYDLTFGHYIVYKTKFEQRDVLVDRINEKYHELETLAAKARKYDAEIKNIMSEFNLENHA